MRTEKSRSTFCESSGYSNQPLITLNLAHLTKSVLFKYTSKNREGGRPSCRYSFEFREFQKLKTVSSRVSLDNNPVKDIENGKKVLRHKKCTKIEKMYRGSNGKYSRVVHTTFHSSFGLVTFWPKSPKSPKMTKC